MIIVSQTDELVNFRNVLVVTIDRDGNRCYLKAHYDKNLYTRIGCYKTEERAKAVLEDIADRNEVINYAKISCGFKLNLSDDNFKYQMPLE